MISTMIKMAATLILISGAGSAFADGHGGGFEPPPPIPNSNGGIGTLVDLNITGGTFTMSDSVRAIGTTTFGPIGFDLVDGYGSQSALFGWLGIPWNVFTGNGTMTPYGGTGSPLTGGPVPTGTATANTISFDLSAFSANWNGNNFNQGHSAVTGNYDSGTGAFNGSWSLVNTEGPFQGFTSTWTVTGVATAVPEASTYTMMLVGLGLVGSMAVRRRLAKFNSN